MRKRSVNLKHLADQADQGKLQCFRYVQRMEEGRFIEEDKTRSDVKGIRAR